MGGVRALPTVGERLYADVLTADINEKGVLDVDTVKGCTAGMSARPDGGCYHSCYAAKIAKFRGIDFGVAVTRKVKSRAHAAAIERAVKAAPEGFFRVGTMGDPCHDWEETVQTIEWLSEFARPVVITKHWMIASDDQLRRLNESGTVLNTSVSALDTPAELRHRKRQIERFRDLGGASIARIVSCEFIRSHSEGARMGAIQDDLFTWRPTLDNPLRVPATYPLAVSGIIRLSMVQDINTVRSVSLANKSTYLGRCSGCSDLCGLSLVGDSAIPPSHEARVERPQAKPYHNPNARQLHLWLTGASTDGATH